MEGMSNRWRERQERGETREDEDTERVREMRVRGVREREEGKGRREREVIPYKIDGGTFQTFSFDRVPLVAYGSVDRYMIPADIQ